MSQIIDLHTRRQETDPSRYAANIETEPMQVRRGEAHVAQAPNLNASRALQATTHYTLPGDTMVQAYHMMDAHHCDMPVQELRAGDIVRTLDFGFQTVFWVGSHVLTNYHGHKQVRFAPGSIGNADTILVAPNHQLMLWHPAAEDLFGVNEILVEARHLVNETDVINVATTTTEFFQILFSRHQIIFADGVPSASLYVNSRALGSYDPEHRNEWVKALPDLQDTYMNRYGSTVRRVLSEQEVRMLQSLGGFRSGGGN
ncbi:Hint domain-containing protein [Roseovarius sp. MMSF_3281]|uniref:Hint domain-containing protein n=1 Tax=Roseovarius sp. MMSF_3281 TaxID=3046694 RepID=UPI00273E259B|nr:Hint domain-containing protein [Roseovarius sp. MMSF_3281]